MFFKIEDDSHTIEIRMPMKDSKESEEFTAKDYLSLKKEFWRLKVDMDQRLHEVTSQVENLKKANERLEEKLWLKNESNSETNIFPRDSFM